MKGKQALFTRRQCIRSAQPKGTKPVTPRVPVSPSVQMLSGSLELETLFLFPCSFKGPEDRLPPACKHTQRGGLLGLPWPQWGSGSSSLGSEMPFPGVPVTM